MAPDLIHYSMLFSKKNQEILTVNGAFSHGDREVFGAAVADDYCAQLCAR